MFVSGVRQAILTSAIQESDTLRGHEVKKIGVVVLIV
jgi:hypothetical protein